MEEEKKDIQTQILELMKKHPDIYTETKQTEDAERRARNFARKIIIEVFPEDKEWVKELSPAFYDCILLYAGWTKETRKNGKITFRLSEKRIVGAFILFRQRLGYILNHLDDIFDGKISDKDLEEAGQIDVYDFLLNYPADGRDNTSIRYYILGVLDRLNEMEDFHPENASYSDIIIRYLTSWHDTDTFMDAVEEYGKDNPYIQRIVDEKLYPSGKTLLYLMVMEQYNSMSASRAETVADNNFPVNTQGIEITESEAETPISEYSAPSHVAEDFEEISFFDALNLPETKPVPPEKPKKQSRPAKIPTDNIPRHKATFRNKYLMAQTKLSDRLPSIPIGTNNQPIKVVNRDSKKKRSEAVIRVSLSLGDIRSDKNIVADMSKLTNFDMSIYDAVVSLIEDGNYIMSPAMIFRKLTGQPAEAFVTQHQIDEVKQSMERLRSVYAAVDHTDQARAYRKDVDTYIIRDYLLVYEEQVAILNGAIVEAYVFPFDAKGKIKQPILHRYADMYKQIQSIPYKLLAVPINNTPSNIELRDYLFRRIWAIRSGSISNKILFSTLYEDLGLSNEPRTKKQRTREAVTAILEFLKKEGDIKGYSENKKGKITESVTIIVSKKKDTQTEE